MAAEATRDPRAEHPGRHRHARQHRLPGGRQDRHDRLQHRRLVRRLHARATSTSVWVGYPKDDIQMNGLYFGRNVDGGTFPADIWGDYMRRIKGELLRRLRAAGAPVRLLAVLRQVLEVGRLADGTARRGPTDETADAGRPRRRRHAARRRHRASSRDDAPRATRATATASTRTSTSRRRSPRPRPRRRRSPAPTAAAWSRRRPG